MRKLGLTLVMAFAIGITVSFAQNIEIKVNPLALSTSDFKASVEYLQSEKVGFEGTVGYNGGTRVFGFENYDEKGYEVGGMAKYYLKPKQGTDRMYLGLYGNYANTNYEKSEDVAQAFTNKKGTAGFFLGYKWVSNGGFFLETGAGLGRHLLNENTPATNSSIDITTININSLHVPGRIAVGLRF